MGQLSQYVTVHRHGSDFELYCDGDFANQKTIISVQEFDGDIVNVFSLKYINMFTKATNMSQSLEIFQGQDMPIILRYCVANLGDLKFYLAPNVD
jgi:proliferating cell nuclear antigen